MLYTQKHSYMHTITTKPIHSSFYKIKFCPHADEILWKLPHHMKGQMGKL